MTIVSKILIVSVILVLGRLATVVSEVNSYPTPSYLPVNSFIPDPSPFIFLQPSPIPSVKPSPYIYPSPSPTTPFVYPSPALASAYPSPSPYSPPSQATPAPTRSQEERQARFDNCVNNAELKYQVTIVNGQDQAVAYNRYKEEVNSCELSSLTY